MRATTGHHAKGKTCRTLAGLLAAASALAVSGAAFARDDKAAALKTMIELDYSDPAAVQAFVDASGYLAD